MLSSQKLVGVGCNYITIRRNNLFYFLEGSVPFFAENGVIRSRCCNQDVCESCVVKYAIKKKYYNCVYCCSELIKSEEFNEIEKDFESYFNYIDYGERFINSLSLLQLYLIFLQNQRSNISNVDGGT